MKHYNLLKWNGHHLKMSKKVRVDKWLWSVRLFKSRTLATKVCKAGKVFLGDDRLKPSHLLVGDEILQVKKNGFNLQIKVVSLIEKRVGAPIAVTCYENLTSEEEMNKFNDWYIGKAKSEFREKGMGRPTKRERREIDRYKLGYLDDED